MSKKPRVVFTIASGKFAWLAKPFVNSVRKFHSEEELPIIVYGDKEMDAVKDGYKYYRATPMFAKELINEYETVIKIDSDSIVTGDLSPLFELDYDVATVYNWNRVDPREFGEIGLATIMPQEYFNNGLVAIRSKEFVDNWWGLCTSHHFDRMPMREQGFLNILAHYGNYNVKCMDDESPFYRSSWWGLRNKGEEGKMVLVGDKKDYRKVKLMLPKGIDNYPEVNKEVKVWHSAGGENSPKLNYQLYFPEEVIGYLDWLTKDENN